MGMPGRAPLHWLFTTTSLILSAMRFLSVAERELRAGARQKGIHRMRWITALTFFGLLAWLMWVFNSFRSAQVFQIYSTLTFFYCLTIGTVRTADCLSSEKREGTVGLLFLTNLNGMEIIGGKLCSNALAAAYGLFAIFPLLALQMSLGGVTLWHFWRTVLALANAILFSMAAGFLASSMCVRQFTAVALAAGLTIFISLGLMGLSAVANAFRSMKGWSTPLAVFSPFYTLVSAKSRFGPLRSHYWWSVLAVAGLSCFFVALATWRVTRSWRDRASNPRRWLHSHIMQFLRERGRTSMLTI